jgi:chromosome segregation ATPase
LLEALKAEAEEKAPIVDDHKNPLPLKEQLEELPSELVELDAAIEDAEKIMKTYDANPEVMRQFERLKNEIEMIQAQLEEISNSKNAELETINKERRDWETRLENHVSKINVLFSMYMEEVGCTGEVRLTKGSQDDNDQQKSKFREWGIEILVSFRNNAKAQVLSAQRHSGGERSVSTIMYLMALQDLMTAPFRCVDEINQGLE